jgi:hypothetical protein
MEHTIVGFNSQSAHMCVSRAARLDWMTPSPGTVKWRDGGPRGAPVMQAVSVRLTVHYEVWGGIYPT